MRFSLLRGDCLSVMRDMPDCSVDSICTDPPYGLKFMSSHWDYDVPAVEIWAECLRVLKPGGHLLAFSGTRTQHRMVVNIEDAGFEIRDMIAWVYGSGFPKSMDVSKAIDKAAGAEREVVGQKDVGPDMRGGNFKTSEGRMVADITAPFTDAARQWEGWGTALKPAHEPICVARKPFTGTVANNVMQYGTGAINIDGCRVETTDNLNGGAYAKERQESDSPWGASGSLHKTTGQEFAQPPGRWPANLIHDGSDEVLAQFPDSNGAGGSLPNVKITGYGGGAVGTGKSEYFGGERTPFDSGKGSAARFFYCAKASKRDRDEGLQGFEERNNMRVNGPRKSEEDKFATNRANHHPTVKPTSLMRYLCRLVTPPCGTVLDPFTGSGSTGKAAVLEGFNFIGIEREAEYIDIARARIAHAQAVAFDAQCEEGEL